MPLMGMCESSNTVPTVTVNYCDEFAFRYENRNVSDSLQAASVRKRGPLGPGMGTVSTVPVGCDVGATRKG